VTFHDNRDLGWMTDEEWEQLRAAPWLEPYIRPGDIALAEAEDRYRRVVERVEARLRTRVRDQIRREKQYAEARAPIAAANARLAARRK
jgi:hypothetical protein